MRDVQIYGELHRFVPVLAHHLGYSATEIPVSHRPRENGCSRYGSSATSAASSISSPSPSWAATATARCTCSGIGLLLGGTGFAILLYLTAIKLGGEGMGVGRC